MKSYAKRMSRLGTETAFSVLDQVKKLEAEGKSIISFCIGEPDFDTPLHIREAGKKAIDDGYTHYGPSAGLLNVRQSCADYLNSTRKNVHYNADEIIITPGGKPIMFYTILALVDQGDEVIYPNPGFPIYESMIDFVGARAVPLPLLEEKEFVFDVAELERLISPKTKLLILNSPQNPCGGVVQQSDLQKVAALAVKHDLWVLSDEIYSRIIYGEEFESITQFAGMKERTIILEGHSKTYAMTGWRLGYGAMNQELAAAIAQLMTNSNSCTATFTQMAGDEAYKGPQNATEDMVKRFQARRDLIVNGLNDIKGIRCLSPRGAFYAFPNVTNACQNMGFKDSVELQEYLLNEAGVAVLARTCFGARNTGEDEEYIRLSYATSEENIKEGLKRIKAALEK
ncbi:aspartate aminotransferase [candidate division KSB3 bacterium]|uniref:Aspartate aminotransferase n=1 Tax=candidate division KSB3 bacterium TaxID=2044937 RepID=A0A2G6EAY4_9BACT|nr:MAG: aspartate aminotransferase [candidate division KSB3 bacterium]PIE30721.1 MAG: aspartate aminotransferase [candidate division KSB3 bacterium]